MNKDLMFSSDKMDWETPWWIVRAVEKHILAKSFDLDACAANEKVAKAKLWYTPEQDAFKQDWKGLVWMNPPYGRALESWLQKAFNESLKEAEKVVCLAPARTDTKYFHNICTLGHVILLAGRIRFEVNGKPGDAAPFPSMLVVFGKNVTPAITCWNMPKS